jgi:hypothetical protein
MRNVVVSAMTAIANQSRRVQRVRSVRSYPIENPTQTPHALHVLVETTRPRSRFM